MSINFVMNVMSIDRKVVFFHYRFISKRTLACLVYLIFFSLFIPLSALAQVRLDFNRKGQLTNFFPLTVKEGTHITLVPDQKLDSGETKEIRRRLLLKVQATLDNLDTSMPAGRFYLALWDTAQYTAVMNELRKWKMYLKGQFPTEIFTLLDFIFKFNHLPNINTLHSEVFARTHFDTATRFEATKEQFVADLIKTDPIKGWLLRSYNAAYAASNVRFLEKNLAYERAWEELDTIEKGLKIYDSTVSAMRARFTCGVPVTFRPNIQLQNNIIYKLFKNDGIFKKLLWYTEGDLRMNPLGFTTPDKEMPYPYTISDTVRVKRFNELMNRRLDSMRGCCDADAAKLEAAVRAWKTGEQRFTVPKNYSDAVLGIKSLADLQKIQRISNRVIIPCSMNDRPKNYIEKYIHQYDAAQQYKSNRNEFKEKEAVADNEAVAVVAHNVPANTAINFAVVAVATPNRSKAQLQVDAVLTSLGEAFTALNPVAGIFSNLIKPPGSLIPNPTITFPPVGNVQEVPSTAGAATAGGRALHSTIPVTMFKIKVLEDTFLIQEHATQKTIIREYLTAIKQSVDTTFLRLYFKTCTDIPNVDYRNTTTVQQSVNKLIDHFEEKLSAYTSIALAQAKIVEELLIVEGLKRASRSLPPGVLTAEMLSDPVYRTAVLNIDFSEPNQKYTYTLTEAKPKEGAAATDSVRQQVAKSAFRSGQRQRFQVSAGVGVTLSDFTYKETTAAGNGFTVKTNSTKVRMVTGLHVYPQKLFLLDDSFMGLKSKQFWKTKRFWSRWSFFAGVGIPEPLKNLYPGISADLVPGIRLIGGVHLFRNNRYTINNNQVVKEGSALKAAGPFVSFNIEPVSLVKALNIFK